VTLIVSSDQGNAGVIVTVPPTRAARELWSLSPESSRAYNQKFVTKKTDQKSKPFRNFVHLRNKYIGKHRSKVLR
jgi:hypothetical protein